MLRKKIVVLLSVVFVAVTGSSVLAADSITIFWAEWDPANYLQELVADYTKQKGIEVNVQTTSWGTFQTETFQEFAAKGDGFDMVVGDSQWLGSGATNGHYVELTNWYVKNGVDQIMTPAAVRYYSEYPAGSKRYWAVPLEGDACGWAYRKDWFEDPREMQAFEKKYGYPLDIPKTWHQLRDIAEFFHRPDQGRYGISLWTERGYDALTMGFENVFFAWGGEYGDPKTFKVDGILNNEAGVRALKFFKELYLFTPPDWGNAWFQQGNQAVMEDLTSMAQNYFAFFPALTNPAVNKNAAVTGYFANPKGPGGRYAALGGQALSINAYSKKQNQCFKFLEWFIRNDVQMKWAKLGGYSASSKVLKSKEFQNDTPYNYAFYESMFMLKDFWNVQEYAELLEVCQRVWHQYLVEDKGTAQEAMDKVAKEWEAIFRKHGR